MHPLISPDYVWLAEGLFTALILGLLFSLGIGVVLLVRPKAVFAMNARLSRWIDTSQVASTVAAARNGNVAAAHRTWQLIVLDAWARRWL